MEKDKDIIINEQHPEVPIIIIERDEEEVVAKTVGKKTRLSQRMSYAIMAIALLAICFISLAAYKYWAYYNRLGISISVTPKENIEKLKRKTANGTPEVVMSTDSILGVALDIYAIHNVQGTIEFQEPDTTDASVYLYCRSVDFTADGRYLGSLAANGKEYAASNHRLGYMAMANGNNVIGFSRDEDVMDYTIEKGGSYFRQFVLVSNGELPPRFYLHGKVERCAIGRIADRLYYITTRHKETLWSFADALREYGFIDAIYITGGDDYSYYRDREGVRHDIHDIADYPHKKWADIIPWLVFRKQ